MSAPLNTGAIVSSAGASNSRPQSNDPANLRSRIVEILAGTANGCLTELGYYPGMPQRLQALEVQNTQWQSENVKLFQDNRSLARALQQQNDASKHMNTIRSLESQVAGLLNERAQLLQHNEALTAGRPLDPSYQRLLSEHHKLQDYYTAALTEIKQLRDYIERMGGGQQSQLHPAQIAIGQPARAPLPSRLGLGSQPSLSPQAHDMPRLSHAAPNYALSNAIVPSQQPANPPTQANQASASHSQAKLASNFQKTLTIVSSWRRHNTVHQPERPSSSRSSSSVSSRSRPSTGQVANSQHPLSLSINITHPPSTQQHYSLPPTPLSAVNGSHPHLPSAIPQAPNPQLDEQLTPAPENISQGLGHTHRPPSRSTSMSEPAAARTSPNVGSASMTAVSQERSPSSDHDSLKRAGEAISEEIEAERRKKQRLADEAPAATTKEEATPEQAVPVSNDDDEDEGSDDEPIEVGPDGLRLVEDCLGALIDDDEENEGAQICRLCLARFSLGYSEKPKPFINATTDELHQHCVTEHQSAWDALRHKV